MEDGRWGDAADHVGVFLGIIEKHQMHDYAISVLAFAAAARLSVHQGDLVKADRRLTRAMRARPACTFVLPFLAIRSRLQMAKVYTTRGDQAASRLLLREIDGVLRHDRRWARWPTRSTSSVGWRPPRRPAVPVCRP